MIKLTCIHAANHYTYYRINQINKKKALLRLLSKKNGLCRDSNAGPPPNESKDLRNRKSRRRNHTLR